MGVMGVGVCVCVLRDKNSPSWTPFGVFVSINASLFILNLCHSGHFCLNLAWRWDSETTHVFLFPLVFPFGRETRRPNERALEDHSDQPVIIQPRKGRPREGRAFSDVTQQVSMFLHPLHTFCSTALNPQLWFCELAFQGVEKTGVSG